LLQSQLIDYRIQTLTALVSLICTCFGRKSVWVKICLGLVPKEIHHALNCSFKIPWMPAWWFKGIIKPVDKPISHQHILKNQRLSVLWCWNEDIIVFNCVWGQIYRSRQLKVQEQFLPKKTISNNLKKFYFKSSWFVLLWNSEINRQNPNHKSLVEWTFHSVTHQMRILCSCILVKSTFNCFLGEKTSLRSAVDVKSTISELLHWLEINI